MKSRKFEGGISGEILSLHFSLNAYRVKNLWVAGSVVGAGRTPTYCRFFLFDTQNELKYNTSQRGRKGCGLLLKQGRESVNEPSKK